MTTVTMDKSVDVDCPRYDASERLGHIDSYSQFTGIAELRRVACGVLAPACLFVCAGHAIGVDSYVYARFMEIPSSKPSPFIASTVISQATVERALLGAQAAWYLGSGLWGIVAKGHYVKTHKLTADPWIFRAHRSWLMLVGGVCALGARQDAVAPEVRALAVGSAAALALNDFYGSLRESSARIYAVDMTGELAFLAGWAWSLRRVRLDGEDRARPDHESPG